MLWFFIGALCGCAIIALIWICCVCANEDADTASFAQSEWRVIASQKGVYVPRQTLMDIARGKQRELVFTGPQHRLMRGVTRQLLCLGFGSMLTSMRLYNGDMSEKMTLEGFICIPHEIVFDTYASNPKNYVTHQPASVDALRTKYVPGKFDWPEGTTQVCTVMFVFQRRDIKTE